MQLVLIKAPRTPDEEILFLKPGTNRIGSLQIEYATDSLIVTAVQSDGGFFFQGKPSRRAILRNGDFFAVDNTLFHCHALDEERTQHAMFVSRVAAPVNISSTSTPQLGPLQVSAFVRQQQITQDRFFIGRNPQCELQLDHPQVSAFHAKIESQAGHRGNASIEDLRSLNGTYVSDMRIRKAPLHPGDSILIMPYLLIYTGDYLNVYTFQQETRLIGWQVSAAARQKKIIDRVTIACASNELVGLIGPSGSGKTTLMKCLSGQTMPVTGRVQLNTLEVFSHFDLLKRNIGFVPQDNILHPELTVHESLRYAAQLRLPPDMSERERKTRIWETLIELELEEQERSPVNRLSGGQTKRVNIAMELLTKPGVLFLDEPTSGLDPALDEKLMSLFKKLSQDGRITIMTTHLLEHANMFSKIAMMHSGHLIFFGTPAEAIDYFEVPTINALYSKIKIRPAEEWYEQFQRTEAGRNLVSDLRDHVLPSRRPASTRVTSAPETITQEVSQWRVLSRRYLQIILRDRKNTGILLLQAPLIAMFILIATTNLNSRLFMMTLAAIWFGCNNSAREICKELPLYRRERLVNLSIVPYLCSKFVILSALVLAQCIVLALITPSGFHHAYWPLLLCGLAGISMGLFISTLVNSPDKAVALVPIVLIPQVLFSGIFGELHGIKRTMGEFMISKSGYNLLKKEFNLPSYEFRKRLESQIDQNQENMKASEIKMRDLQQQLQATLNKIKNTRDPGALSSYQSEADDLMKQLDRQRLNLQTARKNAEEEERELRANAALFVWIDHPESERADSLMLTIFTLVCMIGSAIQLRRRDRLLRLL